MKRYLPFIIITAVALLTVGIGTILYRAKRNASASLTPVQVSAGKPGATPPHLRGQPSAPVALEEFGDFQCPPCAGLAHVLGQIEQDYGKRLCVIFREFPLTSHQHAREAAIAAEAAGLQGRFWEMHDLLYQNQPVWSKVADVRPLFEAYAGIVRLNLDRFHTDTESDAVKARLTSDGERAASLGVTKTPTIFINSHALPSTSMTPERLREAIDAASAEKTTF